MTGAAARLRVLRDWLPRGNSLPYADWQARHRWLLALLWAHAAGLPLFALTRGFDALHAVLEGGAVALFAAAGAWLPLAPRWRGAIVATGLVTSSALLVHFSGGTIEAHFHFFVVILLLALYEDWIPFLVSIAYVVGHHGLVGTLAPDAVYNHPAAVAHPWRWALVHAAFVAAAGAGAVVAWRLNENSRAHAAKAIAEAVRSAEANELKSQFVAMTSHELRTPLTAIYGFATTLTSRWNDIDEDGRLQLVEVIESQSVRLGALIDDLLLLSRLERGKVPVRRLPTRVRELVAGSIEGLVPAESVVVDVPEDLSAILDPQHVAQIATNLVANAQRYGNPPIVVSARRRDGWLELAVSDSGSGVPHSFVPRLFDPFERGEADSPGGAGLGLSIVRGLAEANGGTVVYEPNAPTGARFTVLLPAERGDS